MTVKTGTEIFFLEIHNISIIVSLLIVCCCIFFFLVILQEYVQFFPQLDFEKNANLYAF